MKTFATLMLASLATCLPGLAQSSLPGIKAKTPDSSAVPTRPRTVQSESTAAAAASTAPTKGVLVANLTIHLSTAVPSGGSVLCGFAASIEEVNTTNFTIDNLIQENASSQATVSGSTATCTVRIPYSWYLNNPSSDTVSLDYSVGIYGPVSAINPTGVIRSSVVSVPGAGEIPVPASGAQTSFSITPII